MAIEQYGPKLYAEGRQQFQEHLILEDPAERLVDGLSGSDAVLVAMATGLNAALIGEPGGGKTKLTSDSHRIIDGITDYDVTKVPHTADLTAERLIGSTASTVKTVTTNGHTTKEEISAELKPLLVPTTMVIWMDEVNRVSPFAINGVLGALEDGKVVTDAGVLMLEGLEWAVSTMNPHNKSQSTFRLDPAVVSRHAIGMVLGDETSHQDPERDDIIVDSILFENWVSTPEDIEPVITLKQLKTIREDVDKLLIPQNHKPLARKLIARMLTTWRENEVAEAKGRATYQFGRVARGLGVLRNGSPEVREEDLVDAALLVSCGRLAMGARLEYRELQSVLGEIVA